ncbi:MAG: type II secretion system F family protein [Planctomycetota bacterium]
MNRYDDTEQGDVRATHTQPSPMARRDDRLELSSQLPPQQGQLLELLRDSEALPGRLSSWLDSLAQDSSPRFRPGLYALSDRITRGMHVVDALEQCPAALTPEATFWLRVGTNTGTSDRILEHLIAASRNTAQIRTFSAWSKQHFAYIVLMLLLLLVVTSFLATFIFPTLEKLREELAPPSVPDASMRLMEWTGQLPVFLAAAFVVAFGILLMRLMPRRWRALVFDRTGSSRFGRWRSLIESSDPETRTVLPLLNLIAIVIQSGRPVSSVLECVARYHPSRNLQHRVRQVHAVTGGSPQDEVGAWMSLQALGLLTPLEARSLQASDDPSLQAWILRYVTRQKLLGRFRRADTLGQSAWLVLLLLIAGFVTATTTVVFTFLYTVLIPPLAS